LLASELASVVITIQPVDAGPSAPDTMLTSNKMISLP
jgi:hypothetical protein